MQVEKRYHTPIFLLPGRVQDVKQRNFVINHTLLAVRVWIAVSIKPP